MIKGIGLHSVIILSIYLVILKITNPKNMMMFVGLKYHNCLKI